MKKSGKKKCLIGLNKGYIFILNYKKRFVVVFIDFSNFHFYILFKYSDLSAYFPRHVFTGFRMEEAKNVYNQGKLDVQYFANLLSMENAKSVIKDRLGNNVWMVTTSDDKVTSKNKFLKKEGSFYTLKKPDNKKNFKGWLNTSDNKIYKPGDKVRVYCGMYFKALYEYRLLLGNLFL